MVCLYQRLCARFISSFHSSPSVSITPALDYSFVHRFCILGSDFHSLYLFYDNCFLDCCAHCLLNHYKIINTALRLRYGVIDASPNHSYVITRIHLFCYSAISTRNIIHIANIIYGSTQFIGYISRISRQSVTKLH